MRNAALEHLYERSGMLERDIKEFEKKHGEVILTKKGLATFGIKGEPTFNNEA